MNIEVERKHIREAAESDLPDLVKTWFEMSEYHQKIDSNFQLSSNAQEVYLHFVKSLLNKELTKIFVYEKEGQVVGSVIIKIEERPPVYEMVRTGFIQEISVLEGYQNQGIGTSLLKKAVEWFGTQNISEVSCNYAPSNPKSAGFWDKAGFSIKTVTATREISFQ